MADVPLIGLNARCDAALRLHAPEHVVHEGATDLQLLGNGGRARALGFQPARWRTPRFNQRGRGLQRAMIEIRASSRRGARMLRGRAGTSTVSATARARGVFFLRDARSYGGRRRERAARSPATTRVLPYQSAGAAAAKLICIIAIGPRGAGRW